MSEIEASLAGFHAAEPGMTSHVLAGGGSYERLVAAIGAPSGPVLDVGCGDGHLLALVAGHHPDVALIGVDLSAYELALARARLPGATFQQCRAQSLPLDDGSVAAVVSHLALMLMDPVAPVMSEIVRVLRPGGIAAVAVPSDQTPTAGERLLVRSLVAEASEAAGTEPLTIPLDLISRDGLENAAARAGMHGTTVIEYEVELDDTIDEVWEYFRTTYGMLQLSAEDRAAVEAAFRERATRDAEGNVALRVPMRQLTWRAPATPGGC